MTDIENARFVLTLAVDNDGLSAEDLRILQTDLSFSEKQVHELHRVLEDRFVDAEERARLTGPRLFSRAFVAGLAGRDGTEPLRRRLDHLSLQACDDRMGFPARSEALSELSALIANSDPSLERTRCLRNFAPRLLDTAASLCRGSPDAEIRYRALEVVVTMADPVRSSSFLTRRQTLQVIDLVGEAISDPEASVRSMAVLSVGHLYASWPHDLGNGTAALEAWKERCRPPLDGALRVGLGDADEHVRDLAREALVLIAIPRED
ncbi:MAG TPA: hypothetical protein VFX30_10990 [bacterium]|nr:hypothetical protein [bacterium]